MMSFLRRFAFFVQGAVVSYWAILILGAFSENTYSLLIDRQVNALKFLAMLVEEPALNEHWFQPETSSQRGVTTYDAQKSWGDYTVYTSTEKESIVVMDMQGNTVFEWDAGFPEDDLTFRDQVTIGRFFSDPLDRRNVYVMYFGEKSLLHQYGMKKFDHRSNVLWENPKALHHDVAFFEDGTILTFEQRLRKDNPHPALPHLETPYFEEFLIFIDKDGQTIQEISLYDAFSGSDYHSVLYSLTREQGDDLIRDGDLFHPNTITRVPAHVAARFAQLNTQSVMLSFRNTDMIAFLDLETEKIVWAFYGPWHGQHAPQFLDNGNVIMFDNRGHAGSGGRSRILEVDLQDLSIVWEYTGSQDKPFFTAYNGMIDLLPNGNILVTETHSGRIFEVTRGKDIVWEYYVDYRIEHEGKAHVPSVLSARRFSKEDLAALFDD
ncbi:MAG: arylsulfotransferase family protein [Alphaproteobacteria bacterium]